MREEPTHGLKNWKTQVLSRCSCITYDHFEELSSEGQKGLTGASGKILSALSSVWKELLQVVTFLVLPASIHTQLGGSKHFISQDP